MPIRTVNTVERSARAEPASPVAVVATVPKTVLPSLIVQGVPNVNTDLGFEIAARYIFNDTGGKMYYNIGSDQCSPTNFHAAMADQQMLDCSNFGQQVTVYATASGNVGITVIHRQDMYSHGSPGSLQSIRT